MKRTISISCFIALNIIIFIIFFPWLKGHYATDSYNIINVGYDYYSIHNSLLDGRVFMYLIMQLANIINMDFQILQSILLSLALIVSNISVWLVQHLAFDIMKKKDKKNYVISYIIAFTFVYNFTYIENLYFLECFVMAIAVLLNLIAAKIYCNKKRWHVLKASLLLILSIFCYQGTLSSFVTFVILSEALKDQKLKEFIKNISLSLTPICIACACNFTFVKLMSYVIKLQQSRINTSIFTNIAHILKNIFIVPIQISNQYFEGMFIILAIILILLFIYAFEYKKNKSLYLVFFAFIIFINILCTNLPHIISLSSFNAARTRFSLGALLSVFIIYIFSQECHINSRELITTKRILYSFVVVYFLLNTINYVETIYYTTTIQAYEQEYVVKLAEDMIKYEKGNDIVIKKIQLVYDKNFNAFIPNVKNVPYITWNACLCSWSAVGTINFYSGRNLTKLTDKPIESSMDKLYDFRDDVLYFKIAVY